MKLIVTILNRFTEDLFIVYMLVTARLLYINIIYQVKSKISNFRFGA